MASEPPPRQYTDRVPFPQEVCLRPIGVVRTPHRERHGTPRQAHLPAGGHREPQGVRLELFEHAVPEHSLQDLDGFSRVWILAWLHLNQGWKPRVVPPRGPRQPRGVFATRAPHRPNPIGLSVAEVVRVEPPVVHLVALDLLDGTPVLDVKPYLPFADAFSDARAGWVEALERDGE